jgi:hypothetical protein
VINAAALPPPPYEVHTNRELEFMLTRGKPLAHFSDAYPSEPNEVIVPEQSFAPYVSDGTFEKREFIEFLAEPPPAASPHIRGIRHVLYAKRAEAWRIDAYLAMLTAAAKAGWSEGFERLEGTLLGYAEGRLTSTWSGCAPVLTRRTSHG